MLRKLSPRTHASMKKRPKRLSAIGTLGDAVRQPLCRQGKSTKFFRKNSPKDAHTPHKNRQCASPPHSHPTFSLSPTSVHCPPFRRKSPRLIGENLQGV